jgi:hypothetical protein
MCDVPALRLTDFDIRPFHPAVVQMLQCEGIEDISHQRRLGIMFIEKVKLCQCLGRVLFAQYSPSNHSFGATHKTTITLIPRHASEAELDRCSQKLEAWVSSLPKEAHFIPPKAPSLDEGDNVLILHSAMLRMIYHATCTALHRPQSSISSKKPATQSLTVSRQKIRDAASGTADIVHGLNRLGLTKFLPTSSLTVVTPAAVVHLTNLTSSNPAVRDESAWNFRKCIEVLNELKDIYPAADFETACLEKAARFHFGQTQDSSSILIMQNSVFNDVAQPHRSEKTQVQRAVIELDDSAPEINREDGSPQEEENSPGRTPYGYWTSDIMDDWTADSDDDGNSHHQRQKDSGETQITALNDIGDDDMNVDIIPASARPLFPSERMLPPKIAMTITGDLERDLGFV